MYCKKLKIGERAILDAGKLPVNRLAIKCIQALGLRSVMGAWLPETIV
jgi:hypothetical protein